MGRSGFRQCCQLQQGFLGNAGSGYAAGNSKMSSSKGAGFVKGYNLRSGQGIQVVAAFDQNSLAGGTANAGKKSSGGQK